MSAHALGHKAVTFIRHDFLVESSYKLAFILELLDSIFPVLTFFFLAKLMGSGTAGRLDAYGGAYFPFAVVGVAFSRYFTHALEAMRLALLKGYSLNELRGELGVLAVIALVFLPVSVFIFSISVEKGRRDGSLMKY